MIHGLKVFTATVLVVSFNSDFVPHNIQFVSQQKILSIEGKLFVTINFHT